MNENLSCVYIGREAKIGILREWSRASFDQNRPTIQQQFCQSEVKQLLAKICDWSKPFASCRFCEILVVLRPV